MQPDVWVPVLSLVGVAIGGGLSYLAQTSVQRRSDRREEDKRIHELTENRRAERLELLRGFIRTGQQAERSAEEAAERGNTPDWEKAARDAIDELWVQERMIHILFAPSLHSAARSYVRTLSDVVWQEHAEGTLWERLEPTKTAFLDAARAELDRPGARTDDAHRAG